MCVDAGVYIGCMYAEYAHLLLEAGMAISAGTATGNSMSFMVGRLSYTFGLSGDFILHQYLYPVAASAELV